MGEYNFLQDCAGSEEAPVDIEILNEKGVSIVDKLCLSDTDSFFLTGSRAWYLWKTSSDFDFICDGFTFNRTLKRLKKYKLKYKEHEHFSAIYTADSTGLYNIICMQDSEIKSWKFATNIMKSIVEQKYLDFNSPKDRVYGTFQMLRALRRLL